MVDINKTLDGTLEKAIGASGKLKDLPGFLQTYMLAGDFSVGGKEKVNMKNTLPGWNKTQDYSARLAQLNKSQQEAVFKMTDFGDNTKIKEAVETHLQLAAAGKEVSGALVDAELKSRGFTDALREQILTETGLMDTEGNYLMVSTEVANANGEDIETVLSKRLAYKDCATAVQETKMTEKQLAQSILTTVFGQQITCFKQFIFYKSHCGGRFLLCGKAAFLFLHTLTIDSTKVNSIRPLVASFSNSTHDITPLLT